MTREQFRNVQEEVRYPTTERYQDQRTQVITNGQWNGTAGGRTQDGVIITPVSCIIINKSFRLFLRENRGWRQRSPYINMLATSHCFSKKTRCQRRHLFSNESTPPPTPPPPGTRRGPVNKVTYSRTPAGLVGWMALRHFSCPSRTRAAGRTRLLRATRDPTKNERRVGWAKSGAT